jgi:hypothetical protein
VFPPDRQQANDLEPLEMLAYLCWKLQSPFFLSDEELADAVQGAVVEGTGELRLIFQTREWQHPKVGEGGVAFAGVGDAGAGAFGGDG